MVVIHSASKGLAAMTLAIAHSRGWLDYEERVARYWPEFAQHGKEAITVRQLLAHQAGLFAIDEPVSRDDVADLDRLAIILARQKPAWPAGTRQAYHGLTLGFYQGELLRRVDPRHRSLGQFFQEEIASPLGLDVYIRLPEDIPNSRLAIMALPGRLEMLRRFPLSLMLDAMNRHSNIYRALEINPGTRVYSDPERIRWVARLRRSSGGHRIRLRDQSDGRRPQRRSAGCRAQDRTLRGSPEVIRNRAGRQAPRSAIVPPDAARAGSTRPSAYLDTSIRG